MEIQPAIYEWLKRERLTDPAHVLWRGRSGIRSATRHGSQASDKGRAGKASTSQRTDRANLRFERHHLECDTLWGRHRDDNRLLVTPARAATCGWAASKRALCPPQWKRSRCSKVRTSKRSIVIAALNLLVYSSSPKTNSLSVTLTGQTSAVLVKVHVA